MSFSVLPSISCSFSSSPFYYLLESLVLFLSPFYYLLFLLLHGSSRRSSALSVARHEPDLAARNLITLRVLKGTSEEGKRDYPDKQMLLLWVNEAYFRQRSIED
jgi:hypothetical protein